jgi:glutamyl-tRNA synthetase
MSKRESAELKQSGYSIFIRDLEEMGYLGEAVVNWTALMGWSYDDHTEFFMLPDLVDKFSINRLNPAPAAINFTKLDHFNGLHIRNLAVDDLERRIKPYFESAGYIVDESKLLEITPIIQERLVTLDDAPVKAGFFFREDVHPNPEELIGKKLTAGESAEAAQKAYQVIEALPNLNHEIIEEPLRSLANELGLKAGQLFGILRVAVTGQKVSPPLFESMEIIGKDVVLARLRNAIFILEGIKT